MIDDDVSPKRKRKTRTSFQPLHFPPQKLTNRENQYVQLGFDKNNQLIGRILDHKAAVTLIKRGHPDRHIPVDGNPAHDIIYVWNPITNEYEPKTG